VLLSKPWGELLCRFLCLEEGAGRMCAETAACELKVCCQMSCCSPTLELLSSSYGGLNCMGREVELLSWMVHAGRLEGGLGEDNMQK
jgi:hypothetical protein